MSELLSKITVSLIVLIIAIPIICWGFGIPLELKDVLANIGPWVLVVLTVALLAIIWKKKEH